MISIAGVLVMAMMAIPNSLGSRMIFLACGGAVFFVGFMLFSATTEIPEGHDSSVDDVDTADDIKHPPPIK